MTTTKVLILGATGMLGHKLFQILRRSFPGTVATMREPELPGSLGHFDFLRGPDVIGDVDVTDFDALARLIDRLRPDVVVNAVGIIKQRSETSNAVLSITVNSLLPHWLAERVATWGGRLIHFSTDCVFSGARGKYTEEDPSDATDLYGRSKYLGEVAAANAVTLRSSIIGRELRQHRSLLDWFISNQGKTVCGFRNVLYTGVTTNEMAALVTKIISDFPTLSGIYQVASDPISKFELLRLVRDAFELDIAIEPDDTEVSDRSLVGTKLERATGYRPPPWPVMIAELAGDRRLP